MSEPTLEECLADGGRLLVTLALRQMPYREYLLTNHWQTVRTRAIERAGYRCTFCKGKGPLDGHHLRYDNIGDEPDEDVVAICRPCHSAFHETWQHTKNYEHDSET